MNTVLKLIIYGRQPSVKQFKSSNFNQHFEQDGMDESVMSTLKDLRHPKIVLAYGLLFIVGFGLFSVALKGMG